MPMNWRVLHRLASLLSLGFFARLSNIIIIQGLFVFTALALIIFYPQQEVLIDSDFVSQQGKLQTIADKITDIFGAEVQQIDDYVRDEKVQSFLFYLFSGERDIIQAKVFLLKSEQGFAPIFTFQNPERSDVEGFSDYELSELIDNRIVRRGLEQPGGFFIPPVHSARHSIYYYPFRVQQGLPAVLVTVSEHDLVISNRSQLQYALLVLFLCSTLVSLLTLYLISNRFKEPLNRLIHGLEKTTEGELYYLIEAKGDSELRKLTTAFNKMSRTLREDHKKLTRYNYDLKNANLSLLESQLFLTTLIDSSPLCVVTASSQGKIMIFNRKACEVFSYGDEEAISKNVDELFTHPVKAGRVYQPSGTSQPGVEVLCKRRDGSIFPAYLIVAPVMTRDGNVTAYLYIIRDISESKSFQEMMVRLDRYYTRGEMAGEIAHEINNYLTILSGNIELMPLLLERGNTDKVQQRIVLMRQTVDRIARFADGLMDTNQDETKFGPADINQLVENTVAFLKPQNRFDNIKIATRLSTELPLVELDIGQIQQVMVNLLYNAAEALKDQPGDKKVWIATSVVPDAPERSVRIEVKDNGPGVAEDKEELLFVKRFTTKPKGHGIGLITCRKIVEAHSGRITYRKEEGATFSFNIPIKRRQASGDAPPETVAQPSSQPA